MALKHAYTWAANGAAISGTNWNDAHVVDSDGMPMDTRADSPTAPATGKLTLFGRSLAGRALPASIGEDGLVTTLQPHMGRNKVAYWLPNGQGGIAVAGIPNPNNTPIARTVLTTNFFQSLRRGGLSGGGNWRNASNAGQFFLGSSAGMGGFHYVCRFGTSSTSVITDGRTFLGLGASTGAYGNVNPSTMLNILGIGYDGGDSNWCIFSNDGAGTATKLDLGANFPCTTQSVDVYELVMYAPPNSTTVKWSVRRLNTGDFASGTFSSDIPAANTLLQPHFNVTAGPSTVAPALDLMSLYIETDS